MKATDTDWRREAACTGYDPELFFPIGTAGASAQQTEQARQICQRCPVRLRCLDWAVQVGADHGVWGGLSEEERRALRRRRRKNPTASMELQTHPTNQHINAGSRLRTADAANARNRPTDS